MDISWHKYTECAKTEDTVSDADTLLLLKAFENVGQLEPITFFLKILLFTYSQVDQNNCYLYVYGVDTNTQECAETGDTVSAANLWIDLSWMLLTWLHLQALAMVGLKPFDSPLSSSPYFAGSWGMFNEQAKLLFSKLLVLFLPLILADETCQKLWSSLLQSAEKHNTMCVMSLHVYVCQAETWCLRVQDVSFEYKE